MNRKDAGFTLIEAVVVMAVMVILLTIAVPSMASLLERQRAANAMTSLTTQMAQARMAAITYRKPTILCPSSDGQHCHPGGDWSLGWMLFLDRDNNRRPDPGDDLLRVDLQPRSQHLRLPGTRGRPYLRYLPDGRSAGTNLTINVCNRQGEKLGAVIVNNAGRPRTERPKVPTPCPG
ncbi:prepilin-type N-terminal cleavage/methylation domain-containing protein [Luteimonas aestuarii]|uniref:Type II secretion system protein H n=1 Tax=Luteimonas aestuarii TaxID=453837 RepID=A0A4R5TYH3_9GAMM|nr:GspH/FimT family pseudopilin [Luteimonas aestuarii]TDK26253.1 prepilin-type N-terminal cleavage/methylation domain-containing protein [Luteimonas aestuarii]